MTANTKPVRTTVELRPDEHAALRQRCTEYARQLGVPQVAGAEVVRALLARLHADPALAKAIGDDLARTGGTRRA